MFTFDAKIRYSEIGEDRRLRPESLVDYFQDCSTFQSEELGIGLDYLTENHIAWLVNYWQIECKRMPHLSEEVVVGTSPYDIRGFIGLRNFTMTTKDGEMLAIANSVWSLIDMTKMLPARVPELIEERYELYDKMEMNYEPRKIALPAEENVLSRSEGAPITVMPYHLDTNHHMNNGQYVKLTLSTLSQEGEMGTIKTLRIEYRKQAVLSDVMQPVIYRYMKGENPCAQICLMAADGKAYAVCEVTY